MTSPLKGLAIRVVMIYAALICLTHPAVLAPIGGGLHRPFLAFAGALGSAIGLGHYPLQSEFLTRLVLAIGGGALLLKIRDRNRWDDATAQRIMVVEVRYVLGAAFIALGLAEMLGVSVPRPSQADWIRPIREFQPDHYVTTWIGTSLLHKVAEGGSALAAGICLLFRGTATFGAFLGIGVIGNIVMTNLSFGDPRVGDYWAPAELAGLASVLLLTDLRRLVDTLAYPERSVAPVPPPLWSPERVAKARSLALTAIALVNAPTLLRAFDIRFQSSLAGVYRVEQFLVDSQPVPPERGRDRWQLVAIDDCHRFAVRTIDNRQLEGAIVLDDKGSLTRGRNCAKTTTWQKGTIKLARPDSLPDATVPPGLAGELKYVRGMDEDVSLDGTVDGHLITAQLRRLPDSKYIVFKYLGDVW